MGGADVEGERVLSDVGLDTMTPEITTRAETKSQMPNLLYHPGASVPDLNLCHKSEKKSAAKTTF